MRQRSRGLAWLDSNNSTQQKWAHNYLQRKGLIVEERQSSTPDQLQEIGKKLETPETHPNGLATIKRMRNAWQQAKFRAPEMDRKTCTFKLKAKVKKELAELARNNNTNPTDMLSKLIADGLTANTKLSEKLKNVNEAIRETRERHAKELEKLKFAAKNAEWRNDDLMGFLEVSVELLCRDEVLLQSASISTSVITEGQQREIEKLRKQTMKETKSELAGQMNLQPTGLLELAIREKRSARRTAEKAAKEVAEDL
ncbi:hypothetical protein C1X27_11335 [Pseudomonas sp. MPR-AND1B]|nr:MULTISPECIES: hypothetical protein [unclassified Pseudomonas]PMZ72453.1 hypothetical protein C1X25_11295 [Pseudomonas sp. GW247-3R2A]PMY73080.1 hypothetical protein C1X26_12800 [Pseudomonas sp. MPR-R3A]PMY97937.1 hypothetical protein C1X24_12080 [Pseudomonas sp. FW305-124]PNA91762.1 hypothetical protein C1X23_16725 [Pseudomonas sp. FW300-E2]PNB02854.1 hypothetical protein C1X27_11335 [Pseudomonas sp. MPR-AND1B]